MSEPRHTLYAFVEGADLGEVVAHVEAQCREFTKSGDWRHRAPQMVNCRHPRTPSMRPDDMPDWDLGITLALPESGEEPKGWFADVERTVLFAARLRAETGRDFVVGIWDSKRRISEDLFDVDSEAPNLEELRAVIGVGDAS